MDLPSLGWDADLAAHFASHREQGLLPGRVGMEHQHIYRVYLEDAEPLAHVSGRFRHAAAGRHEYPAVGDWVAVSRTADPRRAVIHAVLPRRSRFSRKVAGSTTEEQVVAANVDHVFLVSGLDDDFNLRRVERYLATAREGGAAPVLVLNKADLSADPEACVAEIARIAGGAPIHAVSAATGTGVDALAQYAAPGRTVALLGSSGVGKSTIINRMLGRNRQRTREVRESDSRGRHTTSQRELIPLPSGGLLIDTPGMRELQLWETSASSLDESFADIQQLASECHFRDCRHETEPRCAVRLAVTRGELDAARVDNYNRLLRERDQLDARKDELALAEQKRKDRVMHRSLRRFQHQHDKRGH